MIQQENPSSQPDSKWEPVATKAALLSQVTLIDGQQQLMSGLEQALQQKGCPTRLFFDIDEALRSMAKTDMVLLDATIAAHPKSSKLINIPTLLVLSNDPNEKLPPWLNARHVFLVPYPKTPDELINRLSQYLAPTPPSFDFMVSDPAHLTLLFGINQTLSGHFLDIQDLFERILALTPYLNADFAALLVQESDETIFYRSTQPGREELVGPAGRRFGQRLLQDGIEGWALRHNEAVLLPNTMADSRWFCAPYLPEDECCVVALPVSLERVEASGVYLIGSIHPDYYDYEDLPLYSAVAGQIGTAIENAMLFKNQSEHSIQLSLMNEVGQAATSILNLDAMLRTVVQAIHRSFSFYDVSIHLYNPLTELIELRASVLVEYQPQGIAFVNSHNTHKLEQGLIGWAMAANQTILVNDVTQEPRYIVNSNNREVRSELCIPLSLGTKTIGVLNLQSTQLEAFDKYHVSALETLGGQLAIAVENARLYDTNNQHIDELKAINQIGQAITSTLDLQETLTLITNETTRLMNVAAASVALHDDETKEIWFAAASGEGAAYMSEVRLPVNKGLAGWVVEHGEPVIVADAQTDDRFFAEIDQNSGFTTKSILCVPLETKGRTIGLLEVMNKKDGVFNQEDQTILQSLAISAATAIENAQLYEEQKNTIKRLEETQQQLVQSGKLAAVGELAAGIAHEINNPLTTIVALTRLLLDTPDLRPYTEDLRMVHVESQRARDIVRNLLDFARADTPKRQNVDLNQIIDEAISLVYTQQISEKITLQTTLAPELILSLDVNQMKQVFVNLLNNAIQAMMDDETNHKATLTITTEICSSINAIKSKMTFLQTYAQGVVICKIADNGCGIQEEDMDKIFDPFFTTKEVGQGTGLGLSISYGILKKHGGDILVDSTLGQGATFTIILPLAEFE